MGGFFEAALSFPTVLFTPLLVVVVGYWLVVIAGGADSDTGAGDGGSGDGDGGSGGAGDGVLAVVGLGGVPPAVVLSLLIAFAWFGSLAGSQLPAPRFLVLAAALAAAWIVTRLAVLVLRKALPTGAEPSRADFVGLTAVVRTGRVTATFGQAEVHAPDGSSALVQVRQAGNDDLRGGTVALLYDFDADGEFFWVVPIDVAGPSHTQQKDG
ncbi:MAG TPA: hypothetical protein VF657_07600 [Actinoplanes sp.]|jgi:hypothetical protein